MTTNRLAGKKVIVTGGSRGIGKAIVLGLAHEGAHVLFTYVGNEAAAKATEAEARQINPNVQAIKADLSSIADMKAVFDYVPANFGGETDIYIGSAFSTAHFSPTAYLTEAQYDSMFASVKGHFFALQQAAQHVAPGGAIIVLSSGAASMAGPASGAYGGAKSAIEKFALGLSKEVGGKGIRVNVVSPGVTETDGLVAPKEMIDGLVAQTPLGRLGQPDDVANAVINLCLPEMAWITSQVIQVNGGIL